MVTWDWWNSGEEGMKRFSAELQSTQTQPRKFLTVRKRIQTFGWRNTAKFYFTEIKNIFEPLASQIPFLKETTILINPIQSEIADQLNNINNPKDEKQKKIIKVEEPEEDSDAATKHSSERQGVFTATGDVVSNGNLTVRDSSGVVRKIMTTA